MTITRKELHDIFLDVKENHKKRIKCPHHDFGKYPKGIGHHNTRLTCRHCGAWMNVLDIIHYADGYAAAGGNPNDVIQGFYNDKEPWR